MDDLIVVKIGGNAISQLKPAFFEKLKYWIQESFDRPWRRSEYFKAL